jgi:hypothetical protein
MGEQLGSPTNKKRKMKANYQDVVDSVLKEAAKYGLITEVRSTAIAFMMEDPTLDSGSAYLMAAEEWDI